MRTSKPDTKGFTIVELLIVIVVIGILAAIVIVAYQGVSQRAKASQYQTDTATIAKKAEAYNSLSNGYALTAAGTDAATVVAQTATAATLTTTQNSINDTKLPSGLAYFAVLPWGTIPTYTQTMAGINANTTVDYYFVSYCATGKGMRIYYPDPVNSAVKTSDVGVCP
jgi:prepilin-type N-terminal cleavage/methylation domain-containing protein